MRNSPHNNQEEPDLGMMCHTSNRLELGYHTYPGTNHLPAALAGIGKNPQCNMNYLRNHMLVRSCSRKSHMMNRMQCIPKIQ